MAAPVPKPTALRVLHGETRPSRINKHEPKPAPGTPECPEGVSDAVREIWDYTVEQCATMGTISPADRDAMLAYCEAVVNHRLASADIAKRGIIVRGARNHDKVKNPALTVQRDAANIIRTLGAHFGLTPSARVGLTVEPPKAEGGAERLLS